MTGDEGAIGGALMKATGMGIAVDGRTLRAVMALAVLILGVSLWRFHDRSRPLPDPSPQPVVVEVQGDVPQPGVYLIEGPRAAVLDALNAAGLSSNKIKEAAPADSLSEEVESGRRLHVERREAVSWSISQQTMGGAALLVIGRKLNINTASEEELCLVPFMKPALARAILDRRSIKPWESLNELVEISGIGPKTVEKWQQFLTVGGG